MPVLVVTSASGSATVVEIGDKAALVGRDPSCTVVLEDPKASGRHLRIAPVEAGGWIVHDLGSTHGTLVGSRRVLRAQLVYGDELTVGATKIRFLEKAPAAPEPAAADDDAASGGGDAPLVSGTLDLKPVAPSEASRAATPAAPPRRAPKRPRRPSPSASPPRSSSLRQTRVPGSGPSTAAPWGGACSSS